MTQPRLLGGRYELDGIVGRGGMAEVFRARDSRLDRIVGVKTLRDDLARDQTFQARFRREAQSAASLNHPSIVAVYDTGEDMVGGTPIPYIVMEFVDGRTLRDLLRDDRRLLPERAAEITDGVLRALDYSHRNGIVHRDIKPGNVMLTRSGDVKVMDFGIARAVAGSQLTLTQTAQVIGTAQYLSPEQARGERVDARSDLYSTGCLLYELLTGRPPFTGDSPVAILYQHVKEEPVPPSRVDPEVPAWADAIVLKAMQKDPAGRYQSAGEMRDDLQRAAGSLPRSGAWPGTDRGLRTPPASPDTTLAPGAVDRGAARAGGTQPGRDDAAAGVPGSGPPTVTAGAGGLARPGSGRAVLAAGAVAAVLLAAAGGYFAFARGNNGPAGGPGPARMLGAGQVGPRSAVPWRAVGAGWVLAEYSVGQPGSGSGPVRVFLVDPGGGRYRIALWPASTSTTTLVAWSGNTRTALFAASTGGRTAYSLLDVRSGVVKPLGLPDGVAVAGFTQPAGLNLLAVRQGPAGYQLERYDLQGNFRQLLSTMGRRPSQPAWTGVCAGSCGAISSPDGFTAVWGLAGGQMQLADNNGSGLIRQLPLPPGAPPATCVPLSWWDSVTVLASCTARGPQPGAARLWLVPVDGSAAQSLTLGYGSGSYTGAWQAGGQVYATAASTIRCRSAASGPGGLGIVRLATSGAGTPITVPGSSYRNAVLRSWHGKFLILAQASCPGTASLEWLDPIAGTTQPLLPATPGQAGVTAAIAYAP